MAFNVIESASGDVRKEKIASVIKWGLGLLGAVVISPVIFLAVKGIVGLGIALVTGLVFIKFAPWVAMKLTNLQVKAIVHEAKANPVETMVNQAQLRQRKLDESKHSITMFNTEVSNFTGKVEKFKTDFPEEAPAFIAQLAKMERLLLYRVEKYKAAKKEMKAFLLTIDKARALWEMSQEAQKMNKLAGAQQDDVIEKLKTDISLESVTRSVNQAFAELDSSLMDDDMAKVPESYTPSIEFKPQEVAEFSEDQPEAEVVPLRRKANRG